jgi:hypothetical protein
MKPFFIWSDFFSRMGKFKKAFQAQGPAAKKDATAPAPQAESQPRQKKKSALARHHKWELEKVTPGDADDATALAVKYGPDEFGVRSVVKRYLYFCVTNPRRSTESFLTPNLLVWKVSQWSETLFLLHFTWRKCCGQRSPKTYQSPFAIGCVFRLVVIMNRVLVPNSPNLGQVTRPSRSLLVSPVKRQREQPTSQASIPHLPILALGVDVVRFM